MRFTYLYKDDPDMDILGGNISWILPNPEVQAHWIHAEYICKRNFELIFRENDVDLVFT